MLLALTREDRIRGCILAGACGDALGAPVEFMRLVEIRARFGEDGIRDLGPGARQITDDTQMTLFTAEGLIRANRRGRERGISHASSIVHDSYLRWLWTQGLASRHPSFSSAPGQSWLCELPAMNAQRAPGNTCLNALMSDRMGTIKEPINSSKGCGGVMRVSPVGLVFRGPHAFSVGAECAAITHGHPCGYLSAGALAMVVAELMEGAELPAALATARAELANWDGYEETLAALDAGVGLAKKGRPEPEDLETLGGGWVGEEALAIALCAALAANDLPDGLRLAANHSGDTDSTAAIAGSVLGAQHGVDAIPTGWLDALELREGIERLCDELAAEFPSSLG